MNQAKLRKCEDFVRLFSDEKAAGSQLLDAVQKGGAAGVRISKSVLNLHERELNSAREARDWTKIAGISHPEKKDSSVHSSMIEEVDRPALQDRLITKRLVELSRADDSVQDFSNMVGVLPNVPIWPSSTS